MSVVLTKAQREELKALSKEVFGSSSRYQKLMGKGYMEMLTEELSEIVPGEKEGDPDVEKMVKIPVKTADGALQYVQKYHTAESVKAYMEQCRVTIEKFKADMAKKEVEEKAKKEQVQANMEAHQKLGGSAL
jgi:predicted PolB exonuclease-like 3'-5' exonuclease